MLTIRKPSLGFLLLPWVLLLAGLGLTYVIQDAARRSTEDMLEDEFAFRSREIIVNIERRMSNYEQVLQGTAGLYAASASVSRDEFVTYVQFLRLQERYPGIQGIGFSLLVRPEDKAAHVAAIRQEGIADYDIRPTGIRDLYTSIIFLEPTNWRNQRAIGYDMYSEPVRRTAMARASDGNAAALSGRVRLVQETETDVQPGFLMYLPVYRPGLAHETIEERRANLLGWVYAPFRANDFMDGILGDHFREVGASLSMEIYDGRSATDADALMFDSNRGSAAPRSRFSKTQHMELYGRPWTVVIHSLAPFEARLRSAQADLVAAAGALTSLLLTAVVWLLVNGRSTALAMAQRMTERLRQHESVLRKRNRDLRLISDCNVALVRANDEHALLSEICRLCVESGGYLMAWVGFAEHDENRTVRPVAQHGYESGYLDTINISWAENDLGRGPTGMAIRTGKPSVNQDVLTNPAMAPWREAALKRGYRASVALPLVDSGNVLGALMLYASEAHAFGPEEVQLLEELANDLAYGIAALRTRTEHAAAKEQIDFLSHFDPLTHLPNRLLLRDRFESVVPVARNGTVNVALLYLNVDYMKQVNDSLGYAAGDRLLVQAVERLHRCLPDTVTISRVSGDEFAVLIAGPEDALGIAGVADAVLEIFAEPFEIDGSRLSVTFSIGIALYPGDGEDFETLFRNAHTALDSAKEAGPNTYRFFRREMTAGLLEQIQRTAGLAQALRQNEFLLHYQPQIDLRSGRIVGAEALVRWRHPVEGMIAPGKFIPLAERSGHIVPIGEWTLREACRQSAIWQKQFGRAPLVAVNLSALQFRRGNILQLVSDALETNGLRPDRLELELTESILFQNEEATVKSLQSLRSLGVRLSIDDFGTGYSSLAYLKRLAVHKLKIDQSFVRSMLTTEEDASIVRAIIELGHILQLSVIAEGVETEAQRAFLASAGCDEAQGFLYSPAVSAGEFEQLYERSLTGDP